MRFYVRMRILKGGAFMIKIDLITGLLGAGKTTFIEKYVQYCLSQGQKIAVLENDFGAVNVDLMILSASLKDRCVLEMVHGDKDQKTTWRRYQTKLITLGMQYFDRVVIEPSGLFDIEAFFDLIYDPPLQSWYEIGNIITLVDARMSYENEMLEMLQSQIAYAGSVVLTHCEEASEMELKQTQALLQSLRIKSTPTIALNFSRLIHSGYQNPQNSYDIAERIAAFKTVYILNRTITKQNLDTLLEDETCGNIYRIKGFLKEAGQWQQINITKTTYTKKMQAIGQAVFIVIGNHLNEAKIKSYFTIIKGNEE